MMFKSLRWTIFLLFSLTACFSNSNPENIIFESDSRILRGSWVGEVTNYPTDGLTGQFTLSLEASYKNTTEYLFTGTAQLADNSYLISGTVNGGTEEQYLETQTPADLPVRTTAVLKDSNDAEIASFAAFGVSKALVLQGTLSLASDTEAVFYNFKLQKQ